MEKIRVAFFTDTLVRDMDGANKTMFQLVDRIDRDRFEYLFLCGTHSDEFGLRIKEVPTMTVPGNETYKFAVPGIKKGELTRLLDDFAPDVVHIATPSLLGFFGLNYANKHELPVLSIYHTHFISYIKYYLKDMPFLINLSESVVAQTYRRFYNSCDVAYIPTKNIAMELKECGVKGDNFRLWQRGIDTQLFSPRKRDMRLMRSITGNDNPTVLFASRLVWEKNIETLFRVYERLRDMDYPVNFLVAGNGVGEEESRRRMPDAHFLGFLTHEKLAKVYASSDLFLFTSVSETYGNVVIEAMASGCVPVIARGGGSQDLVDDGVTGYLCEPYDEQDYVDRIVMLLENDSLRERMRGVGLRSASKLSWDDLAATYFDEVEDLANVSKLAEVV